jgi:predicted DNA-binding protein
MSKDTTISVSPEFKEKLLKMKIIPEETYQGVIERILEENEELKDENERLEKLEDGMRKEIAKLKER